MRAGDEALLVSRLAQAGEAMRALLALLPAPIHRVASEMAIAGGQGTTPPSIDDIADTARVLNRWAADHRKKSAPVALGLVTERRPEGGAA